MKHMTRTLIISSAALLGPLCIAAVQAEEPATHDHEHSSANSPTPAPAAASASSMQHMQRMHEQLMAAKTPAERKALMAEHMQAMQEAMSAMQRLDHGHAQTGTSQDGMHQHMEMMTMMMRMMMDREQMREDTMSGAPCAAPEHGHSSGPSATPPKP